MKTTSLLIAAALAASAAGARAQHHAAPSSPYAGQESREIKALSPEEQRAWLEGHGAGLARAAELNRHPGPQHVLELAQHLALSREQEQRTRELMHRHKEEVRALGHRLVALERELDRLFARGAPVDGAEVTRLAQEIGLVAGRIRAGHLRTHIEQTALLTSEQVERYNRLRGYSR